MHLTLIVAGHVETGSCGAAARFAEASATGVMGDSNCSHAFSTCAGVMLYRHATSHGHSSA